MMPAPATDSGLPSSIAVSIVTYEPNAAVLGRTLASLAVAIARARAAGVLGDARLVLIDNGPDAAALECVERARRDFVAAAPGIECDVRAGHGNIGYGAGHNLAIADSHHEFHLVLNPDVTLAADALAAAFTFMRAHLDVGWLSPHSSGEDGQIQYLCKRYPSPLVLALRGFAPTFVRAWFSEELARYEMRDVLGESDAVWDVPIATGAFMFCRTDALHRIGGFDPRYFLYFEDFDLSLRMANVARLAYVPTVRIVHLGGRSARKGSAHVRMFAASALRFFWKHGWRSPPTAPCPAREARR